MSVATEPAVANFIVRDGNIYVIADYGKKDVLKAVPGARWSAADGAWFYPATNRHATILREMLKPYGRLRADAAFRELLVKSDPVEDAIRSANFDGPAPLTPLWGHQEAAVEKALRRRAYYFAHDMGAGKTLSTIALLLRRQHQKILIICPRPRLVDEWVDQLEKHAGDMIVPCGPTKGDMKKRLGIMKQAIKDYAPCAVIVNYQAASQEPFKSWSLKQHWDIVILDEAHKIKTPGGVWSRYCSVLARRADYRLCLSGTPMPHSPLDIYGQLRFLDEEIFGTSFAVFRNRYAIMGGFNNHQVLRIINEADLNEKFYSIADRVITRDVLDMPEERDIDIMVDLKERARAAYTEMKNDFYTKVGTGEITASNALTQLLRLQQITGGYLPDEDGNLHRIDDAKREALADLIEGLPPSEPLVVFARFTADLAEIEAATIKAEKRYGELSGRRDDYNDFGDGKVDVIGIQIQAGAEGLNRLVRARYACYYSLGFSLNDYTQSRRRLMRPGQTRNVVYYHLIARDTVDERVYKALAARQSVIDAVLEIEHA